MRKHVRPAQATASIPDPERGDSLPPEGRAVTWTPHWALMAMREEISVHDVDEEAEAAPAAPDAAPVADHGPEAAEAHAEA